MRSASAIAIPLLLAACAGLTRPVPPGVPAEVRDAALASNPAWEILESLMVEVGPRFAGTEGDRRAVEWALATMKRLGLDDVRAEPVTVPRWVRGHAWAEIVVPFPATLAVTALGGSVGTPAGGVVAEVVRYEHVSELEALEAGSLEGRIVFLDRRMERRRDGSDYGPTVKNRSDGPSVAASKGAVAVVIRSVGTGTHRFPHTGQTRYRDGVEKIPAAALAIPDADLLAAQLERGTVRMRLDLGSRYLSDTQSANVVGEVRGRSRPEEIVLIGAHLDSWDLGPSAHDDGTGVAIALAVAKLLKERGVPPERTVRVVLYANEEFGLSGAKAYAAAHAGELDKHVVAVESDFGGGRVWRFRTLFRPGAEAAAEDAYRLLAPLGIEWGGNTARGGADLRPLRENRVPVVDLTHDGTYYFDYHHTADDTLDKVDPASLTQAVAAHTAFVAWAADGDAVLGPAPVEENKESH